eukprot:s563_g24.t1
MLTFGYSAPIHRRVLARSFQSELCTPVPTAMACSGRLAESTMASLIPLPSGISQPSLLSLCHGVSRRSMKQQSMEHLNGRNMEDNFNWNAIGIGLTLYRILCTLLFLFWVTRALFKAFGKTIFLGSVSFEPSARAGWGMMVIRSIWELFRREPRPPQRVNRGSVAYGEPGTFSAGLEPPNRSDTTFALRRAVTQDSFLQEFLQRHGFSSPTSPRQLGDSDSKIQLERWYPLHIAAQLGDHDIVGLLLEARADPEQLGEGNRTAIDVAQAENRYVLYLLRDAVAMKRQEGERERQFGPFGSRQMHSPDDEAMKHLMLGRAKLLRMGWKNSSRARDADLVVKTLLGREGMDEPLQRPYCHSLSNLVLSLVEALRVQRGWLQQLRGTLQSVVLGFHYDQILTHSARRCFCWHRACRCTGAVLNEDALVRICRFLPARPLLEMGTSCSDFCHRARNSKELWKGLCSFLLGDTTLMLHEANCSSSSSAEFYRRLFRAAWSCEDFCYDHRLRRSLLMSLQNQVEGEGSRNQSGAELLCMSGHTSETLGPLVIQIGGMRNSLQPDDIVHVTVINLQNRQILRPGLTEDSMKPLQRMRHASCVVMPNSLPDAAFPGAILVLGGHDANTRAFRLGTPRPAMRRLMFLQVMREDGSQIRWIERQAFGTIPEYMYNLACASFAGGTKVCVFGGDIPTSEEEYERIQDRTCCSFVYVLELASCTWSAVRTRGLAPDWRSFHAAVSHTSFLDGKDYLITFGGSSEHCEPLAGGHLADMRGYQLDLHDFKWQMGPAEDLPAPRLRFGVARYGRHLLVHGGHGNGLHASVARLNLHTLKWGRLKFSNAPPPLGAHAFETGTPQAGIVVGGAQQTVLGPRILQRLVVLRLRDHLVEEDGALAPEESHIATGDDESSEGSEMTMTEVRLQIQTAGGQRRVVSIPVSMLAALGSDQAGADGLRRLLQAVEDQNDDAEDDPHGARPAP